MLFKCFYNWENKEGKKGTTFYIFTESVEFKVDENLYAKTDAIDLGERHIFSKDGVKNVWYTA